MADLRNPRAKLARADEHLQELVAEAREFATSEPYSVINEERAADLDVALIHMREPPPHRLGLIFGDVLANWRSALDNLANQLVLLNGKDPGSSTSFPIFSSETDFVRRGKKRIKGVSQGHARIIEGLQPFKNHDDPTVRALETVNEHVVVDKHRAIHPTISAVVNARGYAHSFRREDLTTELYFEVDPVGFDKPLHNGMELAYIRWWPPMPNPKPRMTADFPVELAFGDKGLKLRALPQIGWQLKAVVECFAADFGEPMELPVSYWKSSETKRR